MSDNKPDFSMWTILVVDDDLHNLDILSKFFRKRQATVYIATNGDAAVEILDEITPSIILTDLSMPEMDGWATLEYIRNSRHRDTPVIAVTAHATLESKKQAHAVGFDGYFTKPLRLRALVDKMVALLE